MSFPDRRQRAESRRSFIQKTGLLLGGSLMLSALPDSLGQTSPVKSFAPTSRDRLISLATATERLSFESTTDLASLTSEYFSGYYSGFAERSPSLKPIFIIDTPHDGDKTQEEYVYSLMKDDPNRFNLPALQDLKRRYGDIFTPDDLESVLVQFAQKEPFSYYSDNLFINLTAFNSQTFRSSSDRRIEFMGDNPTNTPATPAQSLRADLFLERVQETLPTEKVPLEPEIQAAFTESYAIPLNQPPMGPQVDGLLTSGTKSGFSLLVDYRDDQGKRITEEGDGDVNKFVAAYLGYQADRSLEIPYTPPMFWNHPAKFADFINFGLVLEQANISSVELYQMIQTSDIKTFWTRLADGAKPGLAEYEKLKIAADMLHGGRVSESPGGIYPFPRWKAFRPYFPRIHAPLSETQ